MSELQDKKEPDLQELTEKISELMKEYEIENHIMCFSVDGNVLLHYSDEYESAKLIKRGHDIIKEKVWDKIN